MSTHTVQIENTQPDTIDPYGKPEPFWFADCRHGFWEGHSFAGVSAEILQDLDHRGQPVEIVRISASRAWEISA